MQRLQNYTVRYRLQINRRKHTELAAISCGLTSWYLLCCLLRINYFTIHETQLDIPLYLSKAQDRLPLRTPTPYCSFTSPYIS